MFPSSNLPELLTKKEAARKLRISVRHLENQIKARALAVIKIGRRVLIEPAELSRFKEELTIQAH
jgi:excisionase family DNA binding protein